MFPVLPPQEWENTYLESPSAKQDATLATNTKKVVSFQPRTSEEAPWRWQHAANSISRGLLHLV